jgi:hypothetical protein
MAYDAAVPRGFELPQNGREDVIDRGDRRGREYLRPREPCRSNRQCTNWDCLEPGGSESTHRLRDAP